MTRPTLTAIVQLPIISESLSYRPLLDTLDGRPFARWWAERMLSVLEPVNGSLVTACRTDKEQAQMADALKGLKVSLYKPTSVGERQTAAEIIDSAKSSIVAIMPIAFALAPDDAFQRIYEHHVSSNNTVTRVTGLAEGAAPLLLNRAALEALNNNGLPLSDDIEEALKQLVQGAHVSKQSLPFALRALPFDTAASYKWDATKIPRKIALDTSKDMARLRTALEKVKAEASPARGFFDIWKDERTQESQRSKRHWKEFQIPEVVKPISSSKTKILFISSSSSYSGAQENILELIRTIDRNRFQAEVLADADGVFAQRLNNASVTVHFRGTLENQTQQIFDAVALLQRIAPQIIHLTSYSGIPILCAANILRIPMVTHVRGDVSSYEPCFWPVEAVIAASEFLKREILTFPIPSAKITMIRDGIDAKHFAPAGFDRKSIRAEMRLPSDAKIALTMGRIEPRKRHDVLLNAAALVRRQISNFHLVLAGELSSSENASTGQKLLDQIQRLKISEDVTRLPFVNDVRPLYATADVLVACGDQEGTGRTVAEAMAMELPTVVTDGGGACELSAAGRGYTSRGGDSKDLAAKIVESLTSAEQTSEMVHSARRYVENELSAERAATLTMQLYDQILRKWAAA